MPESSRNVRVFGFTSLLNDTASEMAYWVLPAFLVRLGAGPEQLGYETPLWTCQRVADLIEREFGIRYHAGHVWRVLRGLGWSPQRPVGRALERNEKAIREWRRVTWPAAKKKR